MKCLQMSLIHDIAEGIVGDYTPYCKITYKDDNKVHNKNFKKKKMHFDRSLSRWLNKILNIMRVYGYSMKVDRLINLN